MKTQSINKKLFNQPGWLHWSFSIVERVPIPGWLLAILVVLLVTALAHLVVWGSGSLPWGQFNLYFISLGFYLVLVPSYWILLAKRAERDLKKFFSDGREGTAEVMKKISDFNSLPEATSLALVILGILSGYFNYRFVGFPSEPLVEIGLPWLLAFTYIFTNVLGFMLFARTIRQASLIYRFYSDLDMDLFNPERIYALSSYGGYTSAMLILFFYFLNLISFPGFIFTTYGILIQIFIFLIMVLLFFIPLSGINSRMKQTKAKLLASANEDLRNIHARIHNAAESQDYTAVDDLHGALSTLRDTREMIKSIPTWPWQPDTLRNVLAPLIFPVIVFLIQMLVERLINK